MEVSESLASASKELQGTAMESNLSKGFSDAESASFSSLVFSSFLAECPDGEGGGASLVFSSSMAECSDGEDDMAGPEDKSSVRDWRLRLAEHSHFSKLNSLNIVQ